MEIHPIQVILVRVGIVAEELIMIMVMVKDGLAVSHHLKAVLVEAEPVEIQMVGVEVGGFRVDRHLILNLAAAAAAPTTRARIKTTRRA